MTRQLLIVLAACLGATTLRAQAPAAGPSDQDRALDALRQKTSEQQNMQIRQNSAVTPPPATVPSETIVRTAPPAAAPTATPAAREVPRLGSEIDSQTWAPITSANSAMHAQALEALRKALADERQRTLNNPPMAKPIKETEPHAQSKAAAPAGNTTKSVSQESRAVVRPEQVQLEKPSPAPAPITEDPNRAKTKQERLDELLREYKADKITPSEYQQRRAKIRSGM